MPLQYFVTRGVNVKNPQEIKYQGRVRHARTILINEIAKSISEESSATEADVMGVVRLLADELSYMMSLGATLELGTLGTFRPVICSKGVSDPDTWKDELITGVNVVFHPGALLREELRGAQLQANGYASTIDISQFSEPESGE